MKAFLLLLLFAGSASAQAWVSKGYQMSAMSYDSLSLHVVLEDGGGRKGGGFERLLLDGCTAILQQNGIKTSVTSQNQPLTHFPCIVLDLTIAPMIGGSSKGDELYYGTLSFNREVTVLIAQRPYRSIGSTWSMSLGGQAKSRFEILGDVEERLKDFLEDYLKLNSAISIWKDR